MENLVNNSDDAIKVNNLINSYIKQKIGADWNYINLELAFTKLSPYEENGLRLFYALLDLKINFAFLLFDNYISGAMMNEQYSINISKEENILDKPELFLKRLDIHQHNSNYIVRYRSMWDKIMGIFLWFDSEKKYKEYNNSRSRKKAFKKLAADNKFLHPDFVEKIIEHIQKFDDSYRTAEVHRFGSLRKYSFLQNPFFDGKYSYLRGSWNWIITIIIEIDKILGIIKQPSAD